MSPRTPADDSEVTDGVITVAVAVAVAGVRLGGRGSGSDPAIVSEQLMVVADLDKSEDSLCRNFSSPHPLATCSV